MTHPHRAQHLFIILMANDMAVDEKNVGRERVFRLELNIHCIE